MSRLTAVFGFLGDDDRQPEQDHVAADLGGGLRQPEPQERRVPEDGERASPEGSSASDSMASDSKGTPVSVTSSGRCGSLRSLAGRA